MLWRDLVITVKLAQFFTVPADSEFYRECPEQNKIEKGGEKN